MELWEVEKTESADLFGMMTQMGHEQVVHCYDEATGLRAIIGIHNTTLGPALGGTRMWNYQTEEEALNDVLRLSRGMTFKAAISGLNLGGGKAVIIGDAKALKSEHFLRRFGKFINSLNGKYITAEDVNMKTADMEYIHLETKFVTGLPERMGGGGDPSPVTAYGVYMGMKATAKHVFGTDSLKGKKVGVQGIGQVGAHLVEYLEKEGAVIFVTDISIEKLKAVCSKYKVTAIPQDEFYDLEMDIYAPCALGATLNDETIPRLRCAMVSGAANNQLKDEFKHSYMLLDRSITYAPDFLINAGGLMNVYQEFLGNYNRQSVMEAAEKIYDKCLHVLQTSEQAKISPQEAAIKLALERIEHIGRLKTRL